MVTPLDHYSSLDPIIRRWAAQHGLHLYTRHQDEEVRVASVVDDSGDTYRIAIILVGDRLAVDTTLEQRAFKRASSRERQEFTFPQRVPIAHVQPALERAFGRICSWIAQAGHTRLRHDATIEPRDCSEPRACLRSTLRVFAIHASAASHVASGSRSLILYL